VTAATLFAVLAAASLTLAARELAAGVAPAVRGSAPQLAGALGALTGAVARAGREGRAPGAVERRRLLAAGAAAAFLAAGALAGRWAGLAAATAGPWIVARVLRARRLAYRRAVDRAAASIALAVADALTGGHSLRGALEEAAAGLNGPPGRELRRVASELELGARTEDALDALRGRVGSRALDVVVAAALVQRRAGGDLARLLRDAARAFEDQARLEGEVRAATAQARFTGLVVVVLPVGAGLLAELASPGYLVGLADSFLTAWLAGLALVMQVVAALAIRKIGRVRA
jgi:tight adherence protein B